jgi:DNA-binding NarL/FixJ family response regulator
LNGYTQKIQIFVLISNEKLKSYIIELCKRNNLRPFTGADLEELVKKIKKRSGAIVVMDYEIVNAYGARIYSRINVACPGCNLLLLCDQDQRDLIKEAVAHDVYACILPPYEEWEVLTMIRNIIAKEKLQDQKKLYKNKVVK